MQLILAAIVVRLLLGFLSTGTSGPRPWDGPDHAAAVVIDAAIFFWSIGFLIWFSRARDNADCLGYPQRYQRGWAFWGWVIPVVSLWIPYRMMRGIWLPG